VLWRVHGDSLFSGAVVPRHIAFWAKAEYFVGKGVGGMLIKALMHGLGAIKVERRGGRAALTAFDGAVPVLQGGDMVAVYPEGTRSPDGRLYRGRTGIARLAVAAGVPIIPVGMLGTSDASWWPPSLSPSSSNTCALIFSCAFRSAGPWTTINSAMYFADTPSKIDKT